MSNISLVSPRLKVDGNDNIIIAGDLLENSIRNPFLLNLDPQGNINYFKHFKTGTSDICYSVDVNHLNQTYLFYNANIGEAGPKSDFSVAKLDEKGNLIWFKQFGFSWIWGQMAATSDGGILISNNFEICKYDSSGNLMWIRKFDDTVYSQNHFEIPSAYIFFRYGKNNNLAYAVALKKNGDLKWNGQLIPHFQPSMGILRSNGNLLFVGELAHPALGIGIRTTFLELDSSNGKILRASVQNVDKNYVFSSSDLSEISDGSILYSGQENLSLRGGTTISRLNDTLSNLSCKDTLLTLNFPIDSGKILFTADRIAQNASIVIKEIQADVKDISFSEVQLFCSFKHAINLDLGKDTLLCPNASFELSAGDLNFDSYLWSTGESSKKIQITKEGTYWLQAVLDCDTFVDSIEILIRKIPSVDLGKDSSICFGDSIQLIADTNIAVWSTGETAASIYVHQAGQYWASITTECGIISDSIQIDYKQDLIPPDFPEDSSLCFGDSLFLEVDPNATFIKWSDGTETNSVLLKKAGMYSVVIANDCDTLKDSIRLNFYAETKIKAMVEPINAQVSDSIQFILKSPPHFNTLNWDFDDGTSSDSSYSLHFYEKAGSYLAALSIFDTNSCAYTLNFLLNIRDLEYVIPNVFSPNADGISDEFEIYGKGISNVQIKIYNRWGHLLFEAANSKWDGRNNSGIAVEDGTYFYVLSFDQKGKKRQQLSGEILLLK